MELRKVQRTGFNSFKIGRLAEGCRLCVEGKKEVIFITGVCPRKPSCFYCPISEKKKDKDRVYANERPIRKFKDIIREAKLCESKGAGVTGGDPLARLDRTIKVIKMLKKEFGKGFHIHLYTPLELVDERKIKKLERAGLDEIRFHPDVGNSRLWDKVLIETKMSKGVEIPVVPGTQDDMKKLISFVDGKIDFLNLNELEVSDTNISQVFDKGYQTIGFSYAVEGSAKAAMELLDWCAARTGLDVHFCTVKLKDGVQLPERIKRRARNVAGDYDIITPDGALIRAAVYTPELVPGFGHTRKLESLKNKSKIRDELRNLRLRLMRKLKIPAKMIAVDPVKLRILTSLKLGKRNSDKLRDMGLKVVAVEDLPTYDEFEIESEDL